MKARGALVLTYLIVGLWFSWQNGYLAPEAWKPIVSVLLSIVLWFLIPLGVNLHIR